MGGGIGHSCPAYQWLSDLLANWSLSHQKHVIKDIEAADESGV